MADECMKRIKKYRLLQEQINKLLDQANKNAPWNEA